MGRESYVYEGMFMYGGVFFFGGWWECRKPRENGRRRWRGVGPAGRPSLFPFGVSVILKI